MSYSPYQKSDGDQFKLLENNENDIKYYTVDMRSDTLSMPTSEMRQAMANAILGDDVYGEDPTTNELERSSAQLLGKEDSLFVPSGTMGNLLAIMVHCSRRGTEAIAGDLSHTVLYEQGGAAQIAGVQLTVIENRPDGTFSLQKLKQMVRGLDSHEALTTLVLIENTHNMCGGKVLPLQWIEDLRKLCFENSLLLHMDGARVFNAAQALNVPVSRIVRDVDSVSFCLSKGLSAPVGSILAGSKDFIKAARRLRKALGGGMRQSGVLASCGLVALEKIVPKLGTDHENAQKIARAINSLSSPNVQVDLENVQTNILLIQMASGKLTAKDFGDRLVKVTEEELTNKITDDQGQGIVVRVSARDWKFARIVVYHQISDIDVELAIKKLVYVIREFDEKFSLAK